MNVVPKVTTKQKTQRSDAPLPPASWVVSLLLFFSTDPSMVSAYMYPAGATGGQAAPQGPAAPTTSPAYSSYQPTPSQGYQVGGQGCSPPLGRPLGARPAPITPFS